ncbi:hypothetical protein HDV64DRAFT_59391 [Trichoderma sp. TUCIM 5745]
MSGANLGSTSELGLRNWSSFDTLPGFTESSEHPAPDGQQYLTGHDITLEVSEL